MSQRVYEYEVACDTCGAVYQIGLTAPAETIEAASLARIVDSLHPLPRCTIEESPDTDS